MARDPRKIPACDLINMKMFLHDIGAENRQKLRHMYIGISSDLFIFVPGRHDIDAETALRGHRRPALLLDCLRLLSKQKALQHLEVRLDNCTRRLPANKMLLPKKFCSRYWALDQILRAFQPGVKSFTIPHNPLDPERHQKIKDYIGFSKVKR